MWHIDRDNFPDPFLDLDHLLWFRVQRHLSAGGHHHPQNFLTAAFTFWHYPSFLFFRLEYLKAKHPAQNHLLFCASGRFPQHEQSPCFRLASCHFCCLFSIVSPIYTDYVFKSKEQNNDFFLFFIKIVLDIPF